MSHYARSGNKNREDKLVYGHEPESSSIRESRQGNALGTFSEASRTRALRDPMVSFENEVRLALARMFGML